MILGIILIELGLMMIGINNLNQKIDKLIELNTPETIHIIPESVIL